ncbi:hypothetical protein LTR17_017612 [Elasticomyces elasticus]|nr:hypothetical protein LTR17_017612 [Elasticomyces elasticus]
MTQLLLLPTYDQESRPFVADKATGVYVAETYVLASATKPNASFSIVAWWLPELAASIIALAALSGTVIVLLVYDGRAATELQIYGALTLNGLIAILATIARASLLIPVCSAIMQEMWLFFADEAKRDASESKLGDMALFANASRGAMGGFVLLVRGGKGRVMTLTGCLITIVALAYSTATQQLVSLEIMALEGPYLLGDVPRSETWAPGYESDSALSANLTAAVYNGALQRDIQPVQASCPSGNCTWPSTPSMAVCSACMASTFTKGECFETCGSDSSDCESGFTQYLCNYTMPRGKTTQLWDFANHGLSLGAESPAYQVDSLFALGSDASQFFHYGDDAAGRRFIAVVELFGVPSSTILNVGYGLDDPGYGNITLTNTECALWPCIQVYDTTIMANVQSQAIAASVDNFNDTFLPAAAPVVSLPAQFDPNHVTNFTYHTSEAQILQLYLDSAFDGTILAQEGGLTITTGEAAMSYPNELLHGLYLGSADLDAWFANLATSMTNVVRTTQTSSHAQYNGQQYVLAVRVRWIWLLLPVTLVLAAILLLIAVMIRTAFSSVRSWKHDLLTMMLFEMDPSLKNAAQGQFDKRDGVEKAIGKRKVRLQAREDGVRLFGTV